MMKLSRRGVLLGLGAMMAAPALVRASSLMPVVSHLVLWNNGVHDDTAAFQAVLDGGTVLLRDGSVVAAPEGLTVRLSAPGVVRRPLTIRRCDLRLDAGVECALRVETPLRVGIEQNFIRRVGGRQCSIAGVPWRELRLEPSRRLGASA
jgi:hypothetical protein